MADDSDFMAPCKCGGWSHFVMGIEQPHEHYKQPEKAAPVTIDREALRSVVDDAMQASWTDGGESMDAPDFITEAVLDHLSAQPVTGTETPNAQKRAEHLKTLGIADARGSN